MKKIVFAISFFMNVFVSFSQDATVVIDEKRLMDILKTYKIPLAQNGAYLTNVANGCGACIQTVNKFMEEHYNLPKVTFIIPFKSEKDLKIQLGSNIRSHKNVIIDTENKSLENGLIETEPKIIYVSKGKVTKVITIVPQNIESSLKFLHEYSQ